MQTASLKHPAFAGSGFICLLSIVNPPVRLSKSKTEFQYHLMGANQMCDCISSTSLQNRKIAKVVLKSVICYNILDYE